MESTSAFPNLKKGGGNGKLLPLSSIPRFQPESTNSSGETHLEKCPIEEQLSWLDDLLNDSGTLFHRSGHRRSASDSCAHLGAAGTDESEFVNAYFAQNLTKSKDLDTTFSQTKESGDQVASSQKVDEAADKAAKTIPGSKAELKRAKQQNAHRSRVRKLQYITHLERTVEILKAEGVGVSAELEFMEQQNMILTMENRALMQRLENISQEQMIKQWEQGMLEREIGRLQSLYHLQKQQKMHHQQHPKHRQTRSIDDHLNTCVSIKNKDDSLNAPIWV